MVDLVDPPPPHAPIAERRAFLKKAEAKIAAAKAAGKRAREWETARQSLLPTKEELMR